MKITVIGTGYVGLVAGACFSDLGNKVLCVDVDKKKVDNLKKGIIPIYEPGLSEIILKNKKNRLDFTTDLKKAIEWAECVFIAVGTPKGKDGKADLKYVRAVAKSIGEYINKYKVIVNKSTVPVGTGDTVKSIIKKELKKRNKDIKVDIVSNPEFLREGSAIGDFMYPDRVVVGSNSKKALDIVKRLYEPLNCVILETNLRSAEMIKYASNAFLSTKISFINEVANVCELVKADVKDVARGMGLDKRIGMPFLNAGIGYGGSCFPKDTEALVQIADTEGYRSEILEAVIKVNKKQRVRFFEKIKSTLKNLKGLRIGILGLAFKPNTDDMRDAPSIDIINLLLKEGAKIKAYDPASMENSKEIFKTKIKFCRNMENVLKDIDVLIVLTEWNDFKELDFEALKKSMKGGYIFDARNIYDPLDITEAGFKYAGVGRLSSI